SSMTSAAAPQGSSPNSSTATARTSSRVEPGEPIRSVTGTRTGRASPVDVGVTARRRRRGGTPADTLAASGGRALTIPRHARSARSQVVARSTYRADAHRTTPVQPRGSALLGGDVHLRVDLLGQLIG